MPTVSTRFPVLTYHEVVAPEEVPRTGRPIDVRQRYADLLPSRFFVTGDAFAAQMRYLKEVGYTTLTLTEVRSFLSGSQPLPPRPVLLTFDDLYQSVRYDAYPLLRELGLRATGFVVGDWIFSEPQPRAAELSRTLSWRELDEMRDVFSYAHHSSGLHTREEHGTAVERAPRDLLLHDLRRLSGRLDEPRAYAYPFGVYTPQTIEWLREAGVELGFTSQPGLNTRDTPALELRRNTVLADTDLDAFARMLD